jgi:hypothetical protein
VQSANFGSGPWCASVGRTEIDYHDDRFDRAGAGCGASRRTAFGGIGSARPHPTNNPKSNSTTVCAGSHEGFILPFSFRCSVERRRAERCRSTGSKFHVTWVNKANPGDSFEIVRNGEEYLIVSQGRKIGATYRDERLQVNGGLMSTTLTYVRKTDTVLTSGFFGPVEYRRQR